MLQECKARHAGTAAVALPACKVAVGFSSKLASVFVLQLLRSSLLILKSCTSTEAKAGQLINEILYRHDAHPLAAPHQPHPAAEHQAPGFDSKGVTQLSNWVPVIFSHGIERQRASRAGTPSTPRAASWAS